MHAIDWILFFGFLAYVIGDGLRRTRKNRTADDYFLAGRSVPWWAVGLSIMATQASAITMIGTTGQGWADGMRFIQFYFALPLAMILIAVFAVPAYHRMGVTTAYEYLGGRFDRKTRFLSALLFLFLRGLSVGFVIYAPSLVLARVFHLPLAATVVLMGGAAVAYTSLGGLRAVIATDVKQMAVMTLGLLAALAAVVMQLPDGVGLEGALRLADAADRMVIADVSWNPSEKYTLWSSLIGGLFLFLSYFGTDQSQVQRLLAGRSVRDAQGALLLNAVAKIPFQFVVLLTGTLLFSFYLFAPQPLSFDPDAVPGDPRTTVVEERYQESREHLRDLAPGIVAGTADDAHIAAYQSEVAASAELREEARRITGRSPDVNYMFLDFILTYLPTGLVGLLLAAIFAAALSSIDSELNAMSTVAVVDIVGFFRRKPLEGTAMVRAGRLATIVAGVLATLFALYAGTLGSLIEGVNRVGSYVYGSLLGVFLLAAFPRANGHGAFAGMVAGMIAVSLAAQTDLAFLYLNTVGTVVVVVVGLVVSRLTPDTSDRPGGTRSTGSRLP